MDHCVSINRFNEFCDSKFTGTSTSKAIRKEKYDRIVDYLKGRSNGENSKWFVRWVKEKGFELKQFPSLGLHDILCEPARNNEKVEASGFYGKFKRVAYVEEFFDILLRTHTVTLNHGGYKNLLKEVENSYSCLPRSAAQEFVNLCSTCRLQGTQKAKAPSKPIIADGFNSRCQIDLIDMSSCPDGEYNWVCHYMDHWSKFHVLFPLKRKTADEVAKGLETFVFPYLGPPRILQSDNGREFVNNVVKECYQKWKGDLTSSIVNGRPRHPQSQGCIEKGNDLVKRMIRTRAQDEQLENSEKPWSSWLGKIMYDMNCLVSRTTKKTPYQLVFGQDPMSQIVPGFCPETLLEETDITEIIQPEGFNSFSNVKEVSSDDFDLKLELSPSPSPETRHTTLRKEADIDYRKNISKMKVQYDKKISTLNLSVGDYVSVKVPSVDRDILGNTRLPCVVVKTITEKSGSKSYVLRSKNGVLSGKYTDSQLERYACRNLEKIYTSGWEGEEPIPLRSAVNLGIQEDVKKNKVISKKKPTTKKPALNEQELITTAKSLMKQTMTLEYNVPRNLCSLQQAESSCPVYGMIMEMGEFEDEIDSLSNLLAPHLNCSVVQFQLIVSVMVQAKQTSIPAAELMEAALEKPKHLKMPASQNIDMKQDISVRERHISCDSLKTVQSCLDDTVIHAFLELLSVSSPNRTLILPCFLATKWQSGNFDWLYLTKKFSTFKYIMIPINTGNHWIILVAKPETRTVTVLNSLPSKSVNKEYMEYWRKFMKLRAEKTEETLVDWEDSDIWVSHQEDGESCGVFILMYAEAIMMGIHPIIMRQQHVPMYRKYIAGALVHAATKTSSLCDLSACVMPTNKIIKWIQCDNCGQWLHVKCAGIKVKDVSAQFYCSDCQ